MRSSNEEIYLSMGISKTVYDYGCTIEKSLRDRFDEVDSNAEYNQLKVVNAMQQHQVSEACLLGTTGYGYNDLGRDTLEAVYAATFHTEDALVRPQITCGTHALALALMSNLRPGDELLSPVGKPYDTLEEVIGIRPSKGSLAEYGVTYRQVDLLPDGSFDYDKIRENINEKTHLVTIQRSKGYQTRPTLSVQRIGELIAFIKGIKPDVICMVDNCYGEFVETIEPSDVGADMIVGSLIKNPGGGLAPIGGYIAGKKECVENAAYRLTSPGLGKEVGASLGILKDFYQGFFLAPTVTAGALKGAIFAANVYEKLGFAVVPNGSESRHDIIQAVTFGQPEGVIGFCQGIQAAAPVDSHVTPEPWDMPGYDAQVIMAAGAFVSGSSIELSADGPIKPPYAVYFQGGLTWQHAKFGILKSLQVLVQKGLVTEEQIRKACRTTLKNILNLCTEEAFCDSIKRRMEDRLTGRLFSHGEYTEERRGTTLKRINWVLIVLVLIGFVIGRFIGTYFDGTFLNYGQNFGLSSPVELNLGFIILTFGLEFNITIASVIGVIIAFVVYRFIR